VVNIIFTELEKAWRNIYPVKPKYIRGGSKSSICKSSSTRGSSYSKYLCGRFRGIKWKNMDMLWIKYSSTCKRKITFALSNRRIC